MWRVTGAAAARPHGGGEVGSDCAAGDRGSDGRVARLRQKTAATVRHTSEDGDGQGHAAEAKDGDGRAVDDGDSGGQPAQLRWKTAAAVSGGEGSSGRAAQLRRKTAVGRAAEAEDGGDRASGGDGGHAPDVGDSRGRASAPARLWAAVRWPWELVTEACSSRHGRCFSMPCTLL
ncbi:hypothetical protein OsJ_21993 [Oryza sativa Japonica Group]|uniref:Uncharacterized protein n=1 Tax=Oryza sativa subsp. japonica TaxID=39947 RepID=A3BDL9_ORYSJ|nr:hypothetical protein OsJ_21993 [Oryza sativa Japonica Group]